ncbi:MAG TPA: transcriptional regulator [Planctomycetaceae bacterium]|nr:transcriptional regulator [Planctomycetaceae bacterium]HIQ21939.1 transcriptional regulator [Planctomycetota bacterium]
MSHQSRLGRTGEQEVPGELQELVAAVRQLPPEYRAGLEPALNRVVESTRRRRRILGVVQEALGQLRLDMKYLMFDLEATRRERDDYRRQLEGT